VETALSPAPPRYRPVMAINETREIVIEASPEEILDVIGDMDSVTEWSPAHQSAEVLEKDKDGRPLKVKMKVKAAGITDEQVVAYTWGKNKVSWTLISSGQQRSQDASYTLTPDGDKTKVAFEISVDPVVPLPGFVIKRAIKGTVDSGTKGLRERVLKVHRGK
jgi:ribosome-associated toxin RatA of RatAB toxin-antitoxin module